MLRLFNTLSRRVEEFEPLDASTVTMYACGFTVYDYAHIGHVKKYVGDDILKRILIANGYKVKHVQNVTDVGHLVSDADEGDDKLEKGARERNMTVWEVAKFFEDYYFKAMDQVNISRPDIVTRATEHISEQIKLIQKLEEKGFTYQTEEAIYFDISKFASYGKLSGQKQKDKQVGVREDVRVDPNKRNPQDFAVWFFRVGHFADHVMHWDSPWGDGFPGWHIECSAMSMAYLGDSIDIHTGGVDHIPVHHEDEIAQSEAATGKKFVNFWVHHNFLQVNGQKMSKSLKNYYKIEDIKEKGFDPMALRYLILTAHYRDKLNFTWESLTAASNALNKLKREVRTWESPKGETGEFWQKFLEAANNDLNLPQAVAVMWEMIGKGDTISSRSQDIVEMDKILGLGLQDIVGVPIEIPENIKLLVEKREEARKNKDFAESDRLRREILDVGYELEDTATGSRIK